MKGERSPAALATLSASGDRAGRCGRVSRPPGPKPCPSARRPRQASLVMQLRQAGRQVVLQRCDTPPRDPVLGFQLVSHGTGNSYGREMLATETGWMAVGAPARRRANFDLPLAAQIPCRASTRRSCRCNARAVRVRKIVEHCAARHRRVADLVGPVADVTDPYSNVVTVARQASSSRLASTGKGFDIVRGNNSDQTT